MNLAYTKELKNHEMDPIRAYEAIVDKWEGIITCGKTYLPSDATTAQVEEELTATSHELELRYCAAANVRPSKALLARAAEVSVYNYSTFNVCLPCLPSCDVLHWQIVLLQP